MPESEKTCSEHLSPPHSDRGHESEGSSRTEEGVGEVAVLDSISDSEKLLEEQEHRKEKYDLKDDEDGISYSNLLLNDEESDKQELLERSSDESDANGDDVESKNDKTKWWFRKSLVRKNWKVIVCSYCFVLFGLLLIVAGIVLEALQVVEMIRGLVLVVMGLVVVVPSGFAVASVYLAAKECCSLSLSKITFFIHE
jgi:hypothetical protein